MTKRKRKETKADQNKDVTLKKEKKKHVFKVKELMKALPKDIRVNYRKDGFVKLFEGNVYLRDTFYGIQMLENKVGVPGKLIQRIETQTDFNNALAQIKKNIKNYVPKDYKKLSDNDKIKIAMKNKTRTLLRSVKKEGESWDSLINRLLRK